MMPSVTLSKSNPYRASLSETLDLSFRIVLTGGYSHLFKTTIKGNTKIDKDLIFKGLLKILKKKFIK